MKDQKKHNQHERSQNHSHDHHHHGHHHAATSSLKFAFFANFFFSIFEVYGGFATNSIAILSDALHDFGDSIALGIAWYLENYSQKERDAKYSYGYRRFSLLGGIISVIILTVGSLYLFSEAFQRLAHPENVDPVGMFWFSFIGIAVNGVSAWRVSKHSSHNHRAAFLHLLEDLLGWVAVLIASVVIYFTGITWVDAILSCLINIFILYNVAKRFRQMVHIFLQGVPISIDMVLIKENIRKMPYVIDVHALQAWSLDGDQHFLNCHVLLKDSASKDDLAALKVSIKTELAKHNIKESAIEFEFESEKCSI